MGFKRFVLVALSLCLAFEFEAVGQSDLSTPEADDAYRRLYHLEPIRASTTLEELNSMHEELLSIRSQLFGVPGYEDEFAQAQRRIDQLTAEVGNRAESRTRPAFNPRDAREIYSYVPFTNDQALGYDTSPRRVQEHLRRYRAFSQTSTEQVPSLSGAPSAQQQNLMSSNIVGEPVRLVGQQSGVTESYRVRLSSGVEAIWKPQMDVYTSNSRAEVLAYEIDRRLGFDLVPPTALREINGRVGSIQLWMDTPSVRPLPQAMSLARQHFLDFLIENNDRKPDNYLPLEDGRVISIDHSLSFTGHRNRMVELADRIDEIRMFMSTDDGLEIVRNLHIAMEDPTFRADVVRVLGQTDADAFFDRANISLRIASDTYRESYPLPEGNPTPTRPYPGSLTGAGQDPDRISIPAGTPADQAAAAIREVEAEAVREFENSQRPDPTRTSTPDPTRTSTPDPTRTSTPDPTRTSTPDPTRTSTPDPTRTSTPDPTRTSTPDPTRTSTHTPVRPGTGAYVRPVPAATETPVRFVDPNSNSSSTSGSSRPRTAGEELAFREQQRQEARDRIAANIERENQARQAAADARSTSAADPSARPSISRTPPLTEAEFNRLPASARENLRGGIVDALSREHAALEFAERTPAVISRMTAIRTFLVAAATEEVFLYVAFEAGYRLGTEIYDRNADSVGARNAGDAFGRFVDEVNASRDALYDSAFADNEGFMDLADMFFRNTVDIWENGLGDNIAAIMITDAIGATAETVMSGIDAIADAIHPQYERPPVNTNVTYFWDANTGEWVGDDGSRYDRDHNFISRDGTLYVDPANRDRFIVRGPGDVGPANPYDDLNRIRQLLNPDGSWVTDENGIPIGMAEEAVISVGQNCTTNCLAADAPYDDEDIAAAAAEEAQLRAEGWIDTDHDGSVDSLPENFTAVSGSSPDAASDHATRYPLASRILTPEERAGMSEAGLDRLEAFFEQTGVDPNAEAWTQEELNERIADVMQNLQGFEREMQAARDFIDFQRNLTGPTRAGGVNPARDLFNQFDVNSQAHGQARGDQLLQQLIAEQVQRAENAFRNGER